MIVVFGTVCLDRVHRVPHWPQVGGYTEIGEELLVLGGEAANTALALQKWGRTVEFFGNSLGNDLEAEIILQKSRELGLATESMKPLAPRSPVCDIYVTPEGDRSMIGRGFSEMGDYATLDGLPLIRDEWFTAEPNFGDLARDAARKAIDAGMKLYLMDYIQENDPIQPGSYWQTSTDWTGTQNDKDKTLKWVEAWSKKFRCHTIVTDGSQGLFYCGVDGHTRVFPTFPCPASIDSTGAGDTFRAGMLLGLDQGWRIGDCLRFGSAAGCLACGFIGATTAFPSLETIQAFMALHPSVADAYGQADS